MQAPAFQHCSGGCNHEHCEGLGGCKKKFASGEERHTLVAHVPCVEHKWSEESTVKRRTSRGHTRTKQVCVSGHCKRKALSLSMSSIWLPGAKWTPRSCGPRIGSTTLSVLQVGGVCAPAPGEGKRFVVVRGALCGCGFWVWFGT